MLCQSGMWIQSVTVTHLTTLNLSRARAGGGAHMDLTSVAFTLATREWWRE